MLHAVIALGIAFAGYLLTGTVWPGLLGVGIFLGREHAQAEYRWIETYGHHLRANMPWWGGFDPRVWCLKSVLDWLLPVLAILALTF